MSKERRGVSEIVSITILILISLSMGITIYYAAKTTIDTSTERVKESIERAKAALNYYMIIDAFYISSNETLVIYLYTGEGESAIFDSLYINQSPIPSSNLISGFGQPIKIGEPNRLAATVILAPGTYEILVTGPNNARAETIVNLG